MKLRYFSCLINKNMSGKAYYPKTKHKHQSMFNYMILWSNPLKSILIKAVSNRSHFN